MRVQVLELPIKVCDEFTVTPFILVFDQVDNLTMRQIDTLREIAREAGAETAFVSAEPIEVA